MKRRDIIVGTCFLEHPMALEPRQTKGKTTVVSVKIPAPGRTPQRQGQIPLWTALDPRHQVKQGCPKVCTASRGESKCDPVLQKQGMRELYLKARLIHDALPPAQVHASTLAGHPYGAGRSPTCAVGSAAKKSVCAVSLTSLGHMPHVTQNSQGPQQWRDESVPQEAKPWTVFSWWWGWGY